MKTNRLLLTLAAITLFSTTAMAADGSIGVTSQANSTVTLDVSEVAFIGNVDAIGFTYTSSSSDLEIGDDVCVYSNDNDAGATTGKYKVYGKGNYTAAGGANATNGLGFHVKHPASLQTIPYQVFWNDSGALGATGGEENDLGKGDPGTPVDETTLTVMTGAKQTWAGACGANNANFTVKFTEDDVLDKPAGIYTGTLTLVVFPDNT